MTSKNSNYKNHKKQLDNSKRYSKQNKVVQQEKESNYYLIPIIIILCFIPLVAKLKIYNPNLSEFKWYSGVTSQCDFFLYHKQWDFIVIAGIMAAIIGLMIIFNKKAMHFPKILIPLGVYALMALLSSIASKYSAFCFSGGFEQFESVFVLLGYCIAVYYAFLCVKSEHDFKTILISLIIFSILIGLLGVFQYLGHDLFASDLGYNMIVPEELRAYVGKFTFTMGAKRVYLTLYNPNYVGVLVALILPIITFMLFFQKKVIPIILSIVSIICLVICLVGSQSFTGIIGIGIAAVIIMIFMRRYLIKRLYITIPVIILLIAGFFISNTVTDNLFINKLNSVINIQKTEYALTDMHTENDDISMTYNGSKLKVRFIYAQGQVQTFEIIDESNNVIMSTYDTASNTYVIPDNRFSKISFSLDNQTAGAFYIIVDGIQYHFTNQTGDGKYYYINSFGKADKLITASSAVFTGYETIASGRGYIWSRTIPLIKDHILLGSGPDTFVMTFPQQDYMNLKRFGYDSQLLTKPHSLYLQIAVQTGLLSLIAFLTFYMMYFVSSFRLYMKGLLNSYYAKFGVAVFTGTIAYMVAGLSNDSSITTAPIFWTLIGIGLAANYKAKPLIENELKELNLKKAESKASEEAIDRKEENNGRNKRK